MNSQTVASGQHGCVRHVDEIFAPEPRPIHFTVSIVGNALVISHVVPADPSVVAELIEPTIQPAKSIKGKRTRRVYTRGVHSGRKCFTPDFGGVS